MVRENPDRLSEDDARILGLESTVVTGHTLKLVILEPGAGPLDIDDLRTAVAQRLPSQPRAMQRVDTSEPGPRWVAASGFDIRDHVRLRPSLDCGSQPDLWRAVSALMSEHLDRARPLWTFDVIGPLADGREAIAARIHHAMADGIAAIRFLKPKTFCFAIVAPVGFAAAPRRSGRPRGGRRCAGHRNRIADRACRLDLLVWLDEISPTRTCPRIGYV